MDDKRLMEIQGLVQGLSKILPSTCPGFENHAPHRTPLEEMGLARALNARYTRRTLAGDLVLELLGAIGDAEVMNRRAHERAARAERERDEARYQVVTLQRLFDDAAAASAKELQEARAVFEAVPRFQDDALSAEDLHQIEARLKRATGCTWTVEPHGPPGPDGRQPLALYAGRDRQHHGLRLLNLCNGDQHFEANAAFIAAAHQDVQTLLAEVHRLRGLLAAPIEPPEPEGWVFGPDLRRALDGSQAVGNDPLVLEVQKVVTERERSMQALQVALRDVRKLSGGEQAVGESAGAGVLWQNERDTLIWLRLEMTGQKGWAEFQVHAPSDVDYLFRKMRYLLRKLDKAEAAVKDITGQLTAERESSQELLDLLKPVEGDDAVDPARVLRLATEPHLDEDGEDVVDELAQAAPRLARALVALRGARQTDWVCECGLPMARNPHPDAGKPDVLLTVGAVYECVPCTVRTRHGWANQARERDLDLQRAQDEIAALRNGLITALGMRWITVRLPSGWSESRAPDDAAIIAWARQLAVQAQSMDALAGRSQTLPEIVLEGRVTSVSLQGSKRLYVRPTRTDALLVFQAASRMRRQGWECIQVRVTLRTQGGEVHLNGAAGWAAQDLISVTFGGEAAEAFYAHASSIGVTIGEWAKVTWPPVDLGASAPAAPVGGGR